MVILRGGRLTANPRCRLSHSLQPVNQPQEQDAIRPTHRHHRQHNKSQGHQSSALYHLNRQQVWSHVKKNPHPHSTLFSRNTNQTLRSPLHRNHRTTNSCKGQTTCSRGIQACQSRIRVLPTTRYYTTFIKQLILARTHSQQEDRRNQTLWQLQSSKFKDCYGQIPHS